ncbi:hypothetical protein ACIRN4_25735 [Pimelobacter simplex]|uniref:hypothetical protein n=1 Tax=Nocardioides simplex TaxID=2045 RepID=UPI00380C3220
MKKLVLGLLAAVLLSAGLVAVQGTAAHAGPYPGTVATTTKAKVGKVGPGKRAKLTVRVKAGAAKPTGKVRVTCTQGRTKVAGPTKSYAGKPIAIKTGKLKKRGVWRCVVKFTGSGVYKSSKVATQVRVRR